MSRTPGVGVVRRYTVDVELGGAVDLAASWLEEAEEAAAASVALVILKPSG